MDKPVFVGCDDAGFEAKQLVIRVISELGLTYVDCGGGEEPAQELEKKRLADVMRRFLAQLPENSRKVFLLRYFYLDSVAAISERFGFTESRVKSMLYRMREKLRRDLEKEDLL